MKMMKMMEIMMARVYYMGVVERGLNGSFGVYFPDLPGCVSAGDSLEETVAGGQEALELRHPLG